MIIDPLDPFEDDDEMRELRLGFNPGRAEDEAWNDASIVAIVVFAVFIAVAAILLGSWLEQSRAVALAAAWLADQGGR